MPAMPFQCTTSKSQQSFAARLEEDYLLQVVESSAVADRLFSLKDSWNWDSDARWEYLRKRTARSHSDGVQAAVEGASRSKPTYCPNGNPQRAGGQQTVAQFPAIQVVLDLE